MTTDEITDDEKRTIRDRFHDAVNMTAKELEHWLGTDESKEVGNKPEGGGESVGHESGRRIIDILGTTQSDLGGATRTPRLSGRRRGAPRTRGR